MNKQQKNDIEMLSLRITRESKFNGQLLSHDSLEKQYVSAKKADEFMFKIKEALRELRNKDTEVFEKEIIQPAINNFTGTFAAHKKVKLSREDKMKFGARLASLRNNSGLTLSKLSNLVGYSPVTISKLELGTCGLINIVLLEKMAKVFQVKLSSMFEKITDIENINFSYGLSPGYNKSIWLEIPKRQLFSRNLRILRLKTGLTCEEVSHLLGIHNKILVQYEHASLLKVRHSTLNRMCEFYDITKTCLLSVEL